ncbi:MAG: hypothetical protein HYZ48_04200 [Chlamydiales bacterium]|nr:hypothetical protein [Chlamydiales bacterium]
MFWIKKFSLPSILLISITAYLLLEQWIDLGTRGFCLQKILSSDLPYRSEWETSPLTDEEFDTASQILSQPFHLIGSGSECFAFASEDGQFVLKCFKLSFARPVYYNKGLLAEDYSSYAGFLSKHPLLESRWLPFFERCKRKIFGIREFRLIRTFSSSVLAYEQLKEETALFYLHLNPTSCFHKDLTLIDGNQIAYRVPIDTTKFILQRKAIPLESHFSQLLRQDRQSDVKECIDSVFELILSRCQKGFSDRDFINRNVGFIGNRAIEIDIGSFTSDPSMANPQVYKKEIVFATLDLRRWLKKNAPELLSYFDEKISRSKKT